jgi:hypothetical protein
VDACIDLAQHVPPQGDQLLGAQLRKLTARAGVASGLLLGLLLGLLVQLLQLLLEALDALRTHGKLLVFVCHVILCVPKSLVQATDSCLHDVVVVQQLRVGTGGHLLNTFELLLHKQ